MVELSGQMVMPGLIDTHVHPGVTRALPCRTFRRGLDLRRTLGKRKGGGCTDMSNEDYLVWKQSEGIEHANHQTVDR